MKDHTLNHLKQLQRSERDYVGRLRSDITLAEHRLSEQQRDLEVALGRLSLVDGALSHEVLSTIRGAIDRCASARQPEKPGAADVLRQFRAWYRERRHDS